MKFKGNIIITDPCYICKENKREKIGEEPDMDEYYTYGHYEKHYPDAIEKIVPEEELPKEIQILRKNLGITTPYIDYKSKLYDECNEKFLKALNEFKKLNADDWELCEYGENMEELGIHTYICRDTLYGDWSCTTFNTDTDEVLGSFCADAGMVGVFLLDEVLKYNPEFDWYQTRPWTTTLIKDFDGEVDFEIDDEENLHVIGTGNINFKTNQTGF